MVKKSLRFHIILVCVVVASVLLFRIGRAEVNGDSATYLYRAVGLVDFLSSKIQTTPLQWFSDVPWWSRLQFHDAPPLAFWIMHVALAISNNSVVAARVAGVVMFVIFVVIAWWWIARQSNAARAWVWVAALGGFSSLLALTRTNLLESYQLLWLGGALVAFAYAKKNPRAWYLVAVCAGAAIITKYTAVFVLMGPMVWLLFHKNELHTPELRRAAVLFGFFLLLPLIYNVAMWRDTGHPDLQVSQALGIKLTPHWSTIKRAVSPLSGENARATAALFFPTMWVMVCGAWGFVIRNAYRTRERMSIALVGALAGTAVQMIFLGADIRFSAGFLITTAVAMGYAATHLQMPRRGVLALLAICVAGGWTASAQTLYAYVEPRSAWLITGREKNFGYEQLNDVIQKFLSVRRPLATADALEFFDARLAIHYENDRVRKAHAPHARAYRGLIIYDARLSWFSSLWYFQRWNLYGGYTLLSTQEYASLEQREQNYFATRGFDPDEYSFIFALNQPRTEFVGASALDELAGQTITFFEQRGVPTRIIVGPDSTPRFKLFGPLALP